MVQKIPSFFFRELQLITVLLLIRTKAQGLFLHYVWDFPFSIPFRFLLKFIFLFNKMHGLFDFKTS